MRIPVPFKVRDRAAAYEGRASRDEIHAAYRASRETDIPLSLLRATQKTIGSERLMQYATDPNTPAHNGPPVVVEANGRHYIHNGHHRATLAAMRGDRTVRARLTRLDSEPRAFGQPGRLLMLNPEATRATYDARDVESVAEVVDGVAILSIDTPLEDKPGGWWSFFDDYESIHCRFLNAIESDDVRAVLLKIDSPGGTASGLNECVDAMLRARAKSKKPVWTYVDEGAYSAAYALAMVGDRVYLPRAGGVGSIGVIAQMVSVDAALKKAGVDFRVYTSGARKADGNPNLPITSSAEAHTQRRVDQLAKLFFRLVADRRHQSKSYVRGLEADTFYGKDAVRKKLADGVMSLEATIDALKKEIDDGGTNKVSSRSRGSVPQEKTEKNSERVHGMLPEQKRVNKATAALAAAQGSKAKATALVEFNAANAALTKALSKPEAGKHYKKTETLDHSGSSGSSSGSSGSSASSGSASSASENESGSMPDASASGSSASASAEEEESDEKALAAAARKITGKASAKEAIGALLALGDNSARTSKSERRIAKLEAERVTGKIEALIKQGKIDCKVTPGNEKKLRKIAAEHGYRALRSFLAAASPAVLPELDDPPLDADVAKTKLNAEEKKILAKLGVDPEANGGTFSKFLARRDKERAGKSIPERGTPKELVSRGKVKDAGDEE